ncbi:MAG: rod shape-determining protein RodA [Deltaproteobacteria bacterium]|nr:rod shape-determining protein RodA [Deltaproteobacteria bacterium]MDQ3298433.1 rod shape-determining protein RodA [Myxococcota bacterium]
MRDTGLALPRATVGVSRWRRFRAAVDWPLIVTVVLIGAIGLLNLYSATRGTRHHEKFDTQVQWMIVGGIAFIIATVVDYRALVRLAGVGLCVAIGLLIVVRLLGDGAHGKGSYRWLNIGGMGIQPSELAKLMVILALAKIFQDADPSRYTPFRLGLHLLTLCIPIVLIGRQPDLGTATLLTLIVLTVGFLAMPSVWPMVHVTLAGLLAIPILWETMHDYQKNRVLAFIDPSSDPTGNGWHTRQSIFAVGSGKIFGKGFGEGTQNQFDFLPEHWTDFPYSVWAEEWGFIGSVFLLAIFSFLVVWILNVAMSARDRAGAVICIGVAAMTFWHVVVNIAMVLGLAPVVGVTLPFISYGGSSLVVFFACMGLVANVSLRKHGY